MCVASPGIAAILLSHGRAAYSAFGIPIDLNPKGTSRVDNDLLFGGVPVVFGR